MLIFYIILGSFVILVLGSLFLVYYFTIKKRWGLSAQKVKYYLAQIDKCNNLSPTEKIINYDKILNHILSDAGYTGTLGEQLKQNPIIIKDLNEIWRLHKFRNKIAHDIETIVDKVLERESKNFEKELKKILR